MFNKIFKLINDFFNVSGIKPIKEKIDYKSKLGEIEKEIHLILKQKGFKKKGRTFNKPLNNGLIQVVNFQISKFYNHYEREFTINLGVYIEELYLLSFKKKSFIREYDCQLRNRLGNLDKEIDLWWDLNRKDIINIKKEIKELLNSKGFSWFEGLSTRDKIVKELENNPEKYQCYTPNLEIALIEFYRNKNLGIKLFKEYYKKIKGTHKEHQEYIEDLGKNLKIKLK